MIGKLKVFSEGREMKLKMADYIIDGQQIDTFCNISIKQKFINETGKVLDCSYVFPNDSKFCIYDTEFVINGKVIKPELRTKEEARKEYDEAIKAGHSAMFGEDRGNGTCEFKLGNLEDKKEAEIHIKASFMCQNNSKGTELKFPLRAKFQEGEVTTKIQDKVNFNLNMKVHQNTSDIKSVDCSVKSEVTKQDDRTYNVLVKEIPDADAIFIKTELVEGGKSSAISSDGYIAISSYPSFETKVETNSEYVFVVDCSGSMSGSRIRNAAKCMKIFIHSLPENCKFAIWRFGSNCECMVESSDYNSENIRNASELIEKLSADLGGTNLMQPLTRILNSEIPKGYARQIFVLTDGEINNTKDVLGFVRTKRNANRIFSIGLGSGADSGLINGLADIANGKGIQVRDNDESLNEKVIDLLETTLQPAITNVSIISEGMTEQWPSPSPAVYNHSQQNFIIKSPHQDFVLISGSVTNDSVDETISVSKAPDGIGLKELFMGKAIEDLQYELNDHMDEAKKAKVIQYSLASKVLSEYTAYVGVDFESHVRSRPVEHCCARAAPLICCAMAPPRCHAARLKSNKGCVKEELRYCKEKQPMRRLKAAAPMCFEEALDDIHPVPMCAPHSIFSTAKRVEQKVQKKSETVDDVIDLQNPDGSWDSSKNINNDLVNKYNQKVAATIAAIAFIRKNAGSKLNSFKLIIRKALGFLKKFDPNVDWEALLHEEESKL